MSAQTYNVLFLCTGNSARSILAEALMNHWGQGKFNGFSAGSFPTGKVNPFALKILERMNISAPTPRSKSWDEFAQPGAPEMDFIFTVCDNAAGEVCPVWPGKPTSAHWGIEDPAAVEGDDDKKLAVFQLAFNAMESRIKAFTALPVERMPPSELQQQLDAIGRL
jgi:arsenate reductase